MRQISLVGAVDEEVGDYFPEFLDMLEESPFLRVRRINLAFLRYIFFYLFQVLLCLLSLAIPKAAHIQIKIGIHKITITI